MSLNSKNRFCNLLGKLSLGLANLADNRGLTTFTSRQINLGSKFSFITDNISPCLDYMKLQVYPVSVC